MLPVFDGDGGVDTIFWIARYNLDGYVLFDEHFERVAEFVWNYH